MNKEEKIKQKEKEYKQYIIDHIDRVHKAYNKIIKNFAKEELTPSQIKKLEYNLNHHDDDKRIPVIFDYYRRDHYPINEKEKKDNEESYNVVMNYHEKNNSHHWQYWIDGQGNFSNDTRIEDLKIAYLEMLCDWTSFEFINGNKSATGETTHFKDWYKTTKKNIKLHPKVKDWMTTMINKVIKYIDDNEEEIFNRKEDNKMKKNESKDFNLVKKESKKLQEDSYEDEIYSDFESNLRDCGYDVERYSDAGMLTNNIGWIVKDPNTGDKLEISVDGSWLDESKKLQEDDESLVIKLGAIEDYLQEVYDKYGTDDVDTKVLYMNGNDSTEFDWDANDRTCEFMLFYKSTEMGFAKCYVTKEGNIEGYYWLDSGNGEGQKIEPSKFGTEEDAEDFKNDLVSAYDMKNRWDTQVGEISPKEK